jgi:hypothetical protein
MVVQQEVHPLQLPTIEDHVDPAAVNNSQQQQANMSALQNSLEQWSGTLAMPHYVLPTTWQWCCLACGYACLFVSTQLRYPLSKYPPVRKRVETTSLPFAQAPPKVCTTAQG